MCGFLETWAAGRRAGCGLRAGVGNGGRRTEQVGKLRVGGGWLPAGWVRASGRLAKCKGEVQDVDAMQAVLAMQCKRSLQLCRRRSFAAAEASLPPKLRNSRSRTQVEASAPQMRSSMLSMLEMSSSRAGNGNRKNRSAVSQCWDRTLD